MPTPEETITAQLDEQGKILNEYNDTVKKNVKLVDDVVTANAETKTKIDKMEADFGEVEKKLAEANAKIKAREDAAEEQEKYLKAMEAKMQRPVSNVSAIERKDFAYPSLFKMATADKAEEKSDALWATVRKDKDFLTAEEKTLTLSDPTTGGYLAPPEFINEIIKELREITPVASLARVRTTGSNTVMIPRRTGTVTAVRRGESESKSATTGLTYTMEQVQLTELYAYDDITTQNLDDSMFDLEAELKDVFIDAFNKKIGVEFIEGAGPLQLEGITVNSTIAAAATVSGHADEVMPKTLITFIESALMQQYKRNASLLLNLSTMAAIRILGNANENFYWAPGFGAVPNTICGKPYTISEDMDDVAAGKYPIAYGDWKSGYTYVTRLAIGMKRIEDTVMDAAGTVRISGTMRANGIVTQTNAIKLYEIAAS